MKNKKDLKMTDNYTIKVSSKRDVVGLGGTRDWETFTGPFSKGDARKKGTNVSLDPKQAAIAHYEEYFKNDPYYADWKFGLFVRGSAERKGDKLVKILN